ncbi:hypothetical protein OG393_01475 [Streptomyces sp. NBC_01216]|uniref:hypothetical protein n=1 Tax=Streptomyces sp. NBC_01216 TaxID=2903778 RepID=UPI002E1533C3|nr:hypothetical protein OG393_01475 [Streptomyces sp. NBC_01216]
MGESEEYFRELRREEERLRDKEAADRIAASGGSSASSGCGCLGWGCLILVAMLALTVWFLVDEFAKREEIRVVTAVLCGKEQDGEDWVIHTGEGDFRLGDVPAKKAEQQYGTLREGQVYDIVFQGMQMPLLPRPVTRGVVPSSRSERSVSPCPEES